MELWSYLVLKDLTGCWEERTNVKILYHPEKWHNQQLVGALKNIRTSMYSCVGCALHNCKVSLSLPQTLFSIKSPGNFECEDAYETSEQEPRLQTDISLEQEGGVLTSRKKGENCWGCLWACEMMQPLLGGRFSFLEEIQEKESLIKMCIVCDRV